MAIELKSCPDSMRPHVQKVLNGEYAVPVAFRTPPRILDIGANVGAFTLWASAVWPGGHVTAFEPHPDNAAAWRENCSQLVALGQASLIEAAVTDTNGETDLFDGPNKRLTQHCTATMIP
jgi:predicted RNA methylase